MIGVAGSFDPGSGDVADYLIGKGGDPHFVTENGFVDGHTALMEAANFCNISVVKVLLDHKVDKARLAGPFIDGSYKSSLDLARKGMKIMGESRKSDCEETIRVLSE